MTDESPNQINRVIAYIRKSAEDNKEGDAHKQLNSLEYQREFAREAIGKYGLKYVREKPFEDDKTGYIAFVREGFNEMVQYLQENKEQIDGIVCTEISRLARNFADGGLILWLMQSGVIKRIYTPTKVFTNSSADQMMVAIEFAMSKKSSDDTGYRSKAGARTKALTLKHPSQPAVLGYKTEGRPGAKKWIIDEEMAPLVVQVFKQYITDKFTLRQLADYAYSIGIRSKDHRSKSSKLSANTWRNRLRDQHYVAIFYVEGERVAGEYPPLIDNETFYQAQSLLLGREHPKSQHIDYSYSDELIKCGRCGGMFSGTNKKGITYYRCDKRREPCKRMPRAPYTTEREIENWLFNAFESIEIDQKTWEAAREYVNELNQPQRMELNKQARDLNGKLVAELNLQTEFGRKYGMGELAKTEYDRLMKDSYSKEALLRQAILKCENLTHELDELMYQFLDEIKYVTKRLRGALPINKREMVEIFCENLEWKDEKLHWDWKKPYFFLANQPNSSTMLLR